MQTITIKLSSEDWNFLEEQAKQVRATPEMLATQLLHKQLSTGNLEDLDEWQETIELLQDPDLLPDIERACQDYEFGEVLTIEDVFGEDNGLLYSI
ncbi:MAG: hypothetical protein AAGA60_28210 [Cyanobacteria bacterium P01_E01_bin.42]